ncbi:MAG: serine/threonine-protein kinase [Arenimonas sp.]
MKTHLGHYEIVSELGRGGMGVVWKGYEPALTRYVAIKELSPALAHDKMLVERFLREARSMAALNDPHIIQIYFIGQENEQPFFVMEFVEGESLSGLIKRSGQLDVSDAIKVLHQAAQGLSTAHDRGVIHRDIKPANLMLNQRGQVKIADFGIALASRDFDAKLTGTGEFVGTPGYLSPEVCLGKPVDQRSDIFALGIVLFEMLTGRTPFSDESPLKLMLDVVQSQIPDVRGLNSEVGPEVAAVLQKMLEKDPDARYQDTHALMADLEGLGLPLTGPLKSKVATPAGPAATLVGMATPVTPHVGMRAPTPPPSVGAYAASASASAPTAQGSTRPGVTHPSAQAPVSSKALWAIAALLVLGLFGSAWAFRGKLFGSETPARGETASLASPIAVGANTAAPATSDPVAPAMTPPVEMPTPPVAIAPPAAPVPAPAPPEPASMASVAAASAAQDDVNDARAERPTLREAIADRREAREERRAGPTRFAVDTSGDPALTIPAAAMIEERLAAAGLAVVDNPRSADVVVRVRAEVIGNQDITFYGQNAVLTTAYLTVKPYAGNRALGAGLREKIDYTPMSAEAKVKQALAPKLDRVVSSAREGQ